MLEIELLGQVRVASGGRPIEGVRNPRLLIWLLLHRGRIQPREAVAFALWPDSTDAQALTNLRRELHLLRHALPRPDRILEVGQRTLGWRLHGPYRFDVDEFEEALRLGRGGDDEALRRADELYVGDLAPGIYEDWADEERKRLQGHHQETLGLLAQHLEARREFAEAARLLRRRLAADPLEESAYLDLMRVAALAGDRSGALQAYHACASTLRAELGVEPGREIREAYERLLVASVPSAGVEGGPVGQRRLIGREAEWATLLRTWASARDGAPTLAFIAGEAGIGKTHLVEELLRWGRGQGLVTSYARSYAAEGALAYAPIAEWLRSGRIRHGVASLDDSWLAEVSRVLPELIATRPDLPVPEPMTESWQRPRLFEALVRAIRTATGPLLLVLDDAQWADRDTLEWLHYLLRAEPAMAILVVLVSRIEELSANPALLSLILDKRSSGELREVELGPLSAEQTSALLDDLVPTPIAPELSALLYRETDGHPLFIVELVRGGLASRAPSPGAPPAAYDLESSANRVPPRLQAVIALRLNQLGNDAQHVAELAATFGRDFDFETMAVASDLEPEALTRALDELWQRRIVREHGLNTYDFSHDRIREVAYAQIGPIRRRLLHRRIGQAIELLHQDDLDPYAASLAAHAEAAGQYPQAIDLYDRAAKVAGRVWASDEAARHLDRAINLLRAEPPGRDRDRRELTLLLRTAPFLLATDGYASARQQALHERARDLATVLGELDELITAIQGISFVEAIGGDLAEGRKLALTTVSLASDRPDLQSMVHFAVGTMDHWRGQQDEAAQSFRRAVDAYQPGRSRVLAIGDSDARTFSLAVGSHALWLAGFTDEALSWSRDAVEAGNAIATPLARVIAHAYAAVLAQWRNATEEMREHREQAAALCRRYDFVYYRDWVVILDAWEHRASNDAADRIERSLEALVAIRGRARRPYFLSLLADVHLAAGRADAARAALDAALAEAAGRGEEWWTPELLRRRSELIKDPLAAQGTCRDAYELAVSQRSLTLALRAAITLARLDRQWLPIVSEAVAAVAEPAPDTLAEARELLAGSVHVP